MDKVSLFRLCAAFSVVGVSLICFLLGGLTKERSSSLFSVLHSFCAGILLGMGFLFDDPDGIAHMNGESLHSAVYIAAFSYLVMLAVEHFNTASLYEYSAVVGIDGLDDDEVDGGGNGVDIELSKMDSIGSDDYETGDQFVLPKQYTKGIANTKAFKFHPIILLFAASASDMVGGIHFSCEEHTGLSILTVMVLHRALMACAFGTLLESSTAPRSIFLYFMLTYCFSTTVGIFAGTFMSAFGFVSVSLLRTLGKTDLVITALSAGVYLYIATIKMIPAGLLQASTEEQRDVTMQTSQKALKFGLFLSGFLVAVLPKLLL